MQITPNKHLREINVDEFSCLGAESVDLSSNAFKTFPKELSKFSNLKAIDLSNNPIKSLGGEFTVNCSPEAEREYLIRILKFLRIRSQWC